MLHCFQIYFFETISSTRIWWKRKWANGTEIWENFRKFFCCYSVYLQFLLSVAFRHGNLQKYCLSYNLWIPLVETVSIATYEKKCVGFFFLFSIYWKMGKKYTRKRWMCFHSMHKCYLLQKEYLLVAQS